MPKLIFRGAFIRFCDIRYDEKAKTVYTKINLTATFSDPVRETMGWGIPPEGFSTADLDGEFIANHFILTPASKQMKDQEIQIDAKELGSFKFVRVKDEDSHSSSQELRFQITTTAPDAPHHIANYLAVVGKSEGQLRVNYEEQAELDMEEPEGTVVEAEAKEDDGQEPVSEHMTGEALERHQALTGEAMKEAPLASAVLLGGTHQKGTRGRRPRNPEAEAIADGTAEDEVPTGPVN